MPCTFSETGNLVNCIKIMRGAGALNIVLGVISLVVGIAAGVLLIISGGKLVSGKSRILF